MAFNGAPTQSKIRAINGKLTATENLYPLCREDLTENPNHHSNFIWPLMENYGVHGTEMCCPAMVIWRWQ